MQLARSRVVVTGATGGIGAALAQMLAVRGARLGLVGRRADELQALASALNEQGAGAVAIAADIQRAADREQVLERMQAAFGGIDILINNAAISDFIEFVEQDPAGIERLFATNLIAPVQLTRAVLPQMLAQGCGHIVNIGSIFGSIAFACFASYSASKFALRGFSEALRRELDGSGVAVTYVAPRAVRTSLNSPALYRVAAKVKMTLDEPASVAASIVRAIEKGRKDAYLGFPESLFVRVNALLPRLVDAVLYKQNRIMREFAHKTTHEIS